MNEQVDTGRLMYDLCVELFPICRSITGEGFRQSLEIIRGIIPQMQTFSVPSGTKVFDWEVPDEWNIRDAYILTPQGEKICDFKKSNLHVVGYSTPVDMEIDFTELQDHLYSLPEQPTAIPYITSYYKERWGFCISQEERDKLTDGTYKVYIDSELSKGKLVYGELLIPGESKEEIFLSTYLCHPSMANNELSGPAVLAYIAKWLLSLKRRKYSYRLIIVPETIGAITYLSRNYKEMKEKVIAGYNLSCMGDDNCYSYLSSRFGDTLADKVALHVVKNLDPDYKHYGYLSRASDERQYCAPGIDLPVCSLMRSKYKEYPEYHTSLDDLDYISAKGLQGGFDAIQKSIECLEMNETLQVTVLGEPQLGKRGLYPNLGTKDNGSRVQNMMNLIAYCDGTKSLLEISEIIGVPLWELSDCISSLKNADLLRAVN